MSPVQVSFSTFFKLLKNLVSQETSHFSHNPWKIWQLKSVPLGRYKDKGNCNIQNCFVHQNGLTVSTKILNWHLWSDDSSNGTDTKFWKIEPCTFNQNAFTPLSGEPIRIWKYTEFIKSVSCTSRTVQSALECVIVCLDVALTDSF